MGIVAPFHPADILVPAPPVVQRADVIGVVGTRPQVTLPAAVLGRPARGAAVAGRGGQAGRVGVVFVLGRVGDVNDRRVERAAAGAQRFDFGQVEIAGNALGDAGDGFLVNGMGMTLFVGELVLAQQIAVDLHLHVVQSKRVEHFGHRQAPRTGFVDGIVAAIQVGPRPPGTIAVAQPVHIAAGIEDDLDFGIPGGAARGGVVAAGVVILHRGEHGIAHRAIGVEVGLIVDVDLVAMAIDDQVNIPAPHHGMTAAIDVGAPRVGGAAKIFPDAARQPDAPAGEVARLQFLHLGMAFRGGVPDVLRGRWPRGEVHGGGGVEVGRDELAADAETVVDVPDVLQPIAAARGDIFLAPADRAQVQAPAFADPGSGGLQAVAFIDGAAVVGQRQVGHQAARTGRDIQRVAVHQPAGVQVDLEVGRGAPQCLGCLRVERDGAGGEGGEGMAPLRGLMRRQGGGDAPHQPGLVPGGYQELGSRRGGWWRGGRGRRRG